MTAEKKDTKDKVTAAVEEIEKAAAEGSPKKKPAAKKKAAPKKKAADAKSSTARKEKTAETKPAAVEKKVEKKAAAPKKKPAKKPTKKTTQQLKITQVKSQIGFDGRQRKVLAGLGLGRIGKQVVRVDDPCIRCMVAKVSHLVTVEEVEA